MSGTILDNFVTPLGPVNVENGIVSQFDGDWSPGGEFSSRGISITSVDPDDNVGLSLRIVDEAANPGLYYTATTSQGSDVVSSIELFYTWPNPSDLQDFSNIASIQIQGITLENMSLDSSSVTFGGGNSPGGSVPGSFNGSTITFDLASILDDITSIGSVTYNITFTTSGGFDVTGSFFASNLISTLVCISGDASILMGDGTYKLLKDIKRGDLIAGNAKNTVKHYVCRVLRSKLHPKYPLDIVRINKDTFAPDRPSQDLVITAWHPILDNNCRRPAKAFARLNGVKYYRGKITAEEILPVDEDNENKDKPTYSLYNLQFDREGFFVANGLVVQSVSPNSRLLPLPYDLYFDKTCAKMPPVWESYHQETTWDKVAIEPLVFWYDLFNSIYE
jgi:hypothetical protein